MKTTEASVKAFKLLSDETRFRILVLLFEHPGICVNEVADAVRISHSAASHQLSKLEARGIVERSRDGKTMCYEIHDNAFTRNLHRAMKLFS